MEGDRNRAFTEFDSAILDGLSSHIAVIDAQGTILSINSSWREFGVANGLRDQACGIGANYLKICRAAVDPTARVAVAGIESVLSGAQKSFYLEYPCHSPDEERWFAMRVTPVAGHPEFIVVSHDNITERIRTETRLRARVRFLEARLGTHTVPPRDDAESRNPGRQGELIILIVDDDERVLRMVSRLVARKPWSVFSFSDPVNAIEWLQSGITPDYILTDYRMPGITGAELIQRARSLLNRQVPALIMTGDISQEVVQAAEKEKCELSLKPLDPERLFHMITEATPGGSDQSTC